MEVSISLACPTTRNVPNTSVAQAVEVIAIGGGPCFKKHPRHWLLRGGMEAPQSIQNPDGMVTTYNDR
jgi:hypothetical protein